jgi:outer membrane protein assembly factor BamA
MKEDGSYLESSVDRAIEEIKDILIREGFFKAEIDTKIERDPQTPQVDVSFNIRYTKS